MYLICLEKEMMDIIPLIAALIQRISSQKNKIIKERNQEDIMNLLNSNIKKRESDLLFIFFLKKRPCQ
jgi:hypothetical protein